MLTFAIQLQIIKLNPLLRSLRSCPVLLENLYFTQTNVSKVGQLNIKGSQRMEVPSYFQHPFIELRQEALSNCGMTAQPLPCYKPRPHCSWLDQRCQGGLVASIVGASLTYCLALAQLLNQNSDYIQEKNTATNTSINVFVTSVFCF